MAARSRDTGRGLAPEAEGSISLATGAALFFTINPWLRGSTGGWMREAVRSVPPRVSL